MVWQSLTIIAGAALLGTGYLLLVRWKAPSKCWGACHTMASIAVSMIVSVGLGFLVFQWEAGAVRSAERIGYLSIVDQELGLVELNLAVGGRDTLKLKDTTILVRLAFLPSTGFQQAGSSGLFEQVQTWRLLALHFQIGQHNFYVQSFMSLIMTSANTPDRERKILSINRRIAKKQSNILENCGRLRTELQLDNNRFAESMISKHKK